MLQPCLLSLVFWKLREKGIYIFYEIGYNQHFFFFFYQGIPEGSFCRRYHGSSCPTHSSRLFRMQRSMSAPRLIPDPGPRPHKVLGIESQAFHLRWLVPKGSLHLVGFELATSRVADPRSLELVDHQPNPLYIHE